MKRWGKRSRSKTPALISSIRECVDLATERGESQPQGSPTAATLASLLDIANVRPHEVPSTALIEPHRFGSPLPRRQISTMPETSFAAVLEARQSVREFSAPSDADLLSLLTHAARARFAWSTGDGQSFGSRPSPSAGGKHPIEIVVAALEVGGLSPGLYWFDPVLCRLTALPSGRDEAREVAARSQSALGANAPPPAVLCLVAELRRTMSRYTGGMSLILRDSGALNDDGVPRSYRYGFSFLPGWHRGRITRARRATS